MGQATGWKTVCLGYPSRSQPLQALAQGLVEKIKEAAGSSGRVFAITHSMGGIVLRHIMGLPDQGCVKWVGCVLLAPPNNGSAVARTMSQVGFCMLHTVWHQLIRCCRRLNSMCGLLAAAEIVKMSMAPLGGCITTVHACMGNRCGALAPYTA